MMLVDFLLTFGVLVFYAVVGILALCVVFVLVRLGKRLVRTVICKINDYDEDYYDLYR